MLQFGRIKDSHWYTINATWQQRRLVSPVSPSHVSLFAHAHRHKRQEKHRWNSLPRILTLLSRCWQTPLLCLCWSSGCPNSQILQRNHQSDNHRILSLSSASPIHFTPLWARTHFYTFGGRDARSSGGWVTVQKLIPLPGGEAYSLYLWMCVSAHSFLISHPLLFSMKLKHLSLDLCVGKITRELITQEHNVFRTEMKELLCMYTLKSVEKFCRVLLHIWKKVAWLQMELQKVW